MPAADKTLDKRRQFMAYAALCLAVLGLTAMLLPAAGPHYARFFGGANPWLVTLGAAVVGGACLGWLQSRYGFEILRGRATLRGIAVSAGLATLLGFAIIIVDVLLRYPEHINVPMPQALLFYPAIGFVAEIVFHVLPLTLVLLVLTPLRGRLGADRIVWIGIVVVAVAEPIYQVAFEENPLSWTAAYTGIHVFAVALLQLIVFRRYDFFSMYALRLFYYVYWHIAWGVVRLEVLF